MKNFLLILALASGFGVYASEPSAVHFSDTPWRLTENAKIAKAAHQRKAAQADARQAGIKKSRKAPASDVVWYAAIQSFTDYDYNFTTTEGLIDQTYEMSVSIDGDQVTLSNFLNYDDEYMSWYGYSSVDVTGTYDAASGTITIPTPHHDGDNMTMVGTDGFYDFALMAGELDKNNDFWPKDYLTLYVTGDFERIYTHDNIGVVEVYDSQTGYLSGSWASFVAQPEGSPNPVVAIPQCLDMGQTYPHSKVSKYLQLLNLSGEDLTYALSYPEGQTEIFVDYDFGDLWPLYSAFLSVEYTGGEPGDFEGSLNVGWENMAAEGSLSVPVKAEVISFPDYSPIVSAGEFVFSTGYDAPFMLKNGDDGAYAESNARRAYQKSWLEASFFVPENHTGHLSYSGHAYCTDTYDSWSTHSASVAVDGETILSTTTDADLDNTIDLEPGEHTIRFTYSLSMIYGDNEDFRMTVSNLALNCELAAAEGVEILTPVVDFGGLLLDGENVSKNAELKIMNTGSELLSITGFSSSNPAFSASLPQEEASLRGTLSIPVTLTANAEGRYESHFIVTTTAGAVQADATALVRLMPDFSPIITDDDGVVAVATDEDHPFIMSADSPMAFNANSGEPDDSACESVVTFTITVPERKMSFISWEAECSSDPSDQTFISVNGPIGMDIDILAGERNASSAELYSYKQKYLEMVPGVHTVEFRYKKNGDNIIAGNDQFRILSFKAVTEDCEPDSYTLNRTQIRFADCIITSEGHNNLKTFQMLNLLNTGYDELRVLEPDEIKTPLPDTTPFSYRNPGYVAQHGGSLMVDLVFMPQEIGEYEGCAIIPTTFGNISVETLGYAYMADGMILREDFSNSSMWDLPGEGASQWFNVADRFSYRPDLYCFSGTEALMSSATGLEAADSYAVSPAFNVPADGGILSWWAAPGRDSMYDESYEVCIVPANYDKTNLSAYQPVFSETLTPDDIFFRQAVVDLAPYAGTSVRAIYHHTTPRAGAIMRLDDVYAYTMAKWNDITASAGLTFGDSPAVRSEYYTIDGLPTHSNAKGIIIVREYHADGSVKVFKSVR